MRDAIFQIIKWFGTRHSIRNGKIPKFLITTRQKHTFLCNFHYDTISRSVTVGPDNFAEIFSVFRMVIESFRRTQTQETNLFRMISSNSLLLLTFSILLWSSWPLRVFFRLANSTRYREYTDNEKTRSPTTGVMNKNTYSNLNARALIYSTRYITILRAASLVSFLYSHLFLTPDAGIRDFTSTKSHKKTKLRHTT